jgi:NAD(P)-dependent dehydrogenase (short-subunit alcohol dehydrogenase family)
LASAVDKGLSPMSTSIFRQSATASAQAVEDPAGKYPAPPFAKQHQPWPGLAARMDPRPDHGEDSYRGSGRLAGRRALITGGDSGMGAAAAIAYAREGAGVVISYLPDEQSDADRVLDQIHAAGAPGFGIAGDLRDEAFCTALVAQAVDTLGGLDILVSNAGRQQSVESILDLTSEEFDATMKTNIYAPFWLIRAAVPHMPPGSVIIGTTSEQAEDPTPDIYHYAMTKAATSNYVRGLGKQLAPRGIRVCGVAPGPIWTPLQVSGGASMEKLTAFGGQTPMGRPGQPGELAGIYVLLAESTSSFTTGAVYGASGGAGKP